MAVGVGAAGFVSSSWKVSGGAARARSSASDLWSSAVRRSGARSARGVPASFLPTSTPRTKTAPSTTMPPISRLTTCRLSSDRSYFSRIRWVSRIKTWRGLRPAPEGVKFPGGRSAFPRQCVPRAATGATEVEGTEACATAPAAEGEQRVAQAAQHLAVLVAHRVELPGGEEQLSERAPCLHRAWRPGHGRLQDPGRVVRSSGADQRLGPGERYRQGALPQRLLQLAEPPRACLGRGSGLERQRVTLGGGLRLAHHRLPRGFPCTLRVTGREADTAEGEEPVGAVGGQRRGTLGQRPRGGGIRRHGRQGMLGEQVRQDVVPATRVLEVELLDLHRPRPLAALLQ